MKIEEKLKRLKLNLPKSPNPAGSYIPVAKTASFIFTSGMLPFEDGEIKIKGKLGKDVDISQGQEAAKKCVLNGLSAIKKELGSLDKIKRIIRVNGFVQSEKGFFEHAKVLNGASDLLVQIFGESGKHTRTAVGASDLPLDSPVELDMIIEVKR